MRVYWVPFVVLAAGGCDVFFALDMPPEGDAGTDDARGICVGRSGVNGTGLVEICLADEPTNHLVPPLQLDTSGPVACTLIEPGSGACVLVGRTIEVTDSMQVIGSRPLILAATQTVTIAGSIDVSAGAVKCNPGIGQTAPGGGGGGAGGSLAAKGGAGGAGGEGGAAGGAGLDAVEPAALTALRGGCHGTAGGEGGDNQTGGAGGLGGGAIYVVAGSLISLETDASVVANGAPGAGGFGTAGRTTGGGGGGGGGSGGVIGLDAPIVTFGMGNKVSATGAGGGAGACGGGSNGSDGMGTAGGAAIAGAGTGGAGAVTGAGMVGGDSTSTCVTGGGGGGGGGSAGFVCRYDQTMGECL